MKICAVCGSSLPDQASVCVSCGSTEFNAPAPQIQYGQQNGYVQQGNYSYGQNQYAQQGNYGYDQNQYAQQDDYGYDQNQYAQQDDYGYDQNQYTQDDYGYDQNQYAQQDDYGYDQNQYAQQDDYGYDQNQYAQQDDYGYDQNQYAQQDDYGYDQNQYAQQDDYGYDQNQYTQQEQPQYTQQEQPQYTQQEQAQYVQQEQPQYTQQEQTQYTQQEQTQYTQQDQYTQQEQTQYTQTAESQSSDNDAAPVVENSTASDSQTDSQTENNVADSVTEEKKPEENPYEISKNFKFEKTDDSEKGEDFLKDDGLKGFAKIMAMFKETPDHTLDYEKEDAAANKVTSIIALFGITFWVPFVFSSNSRYSRFYANQGLLMLIAYIPFSLLYLMFSGMVGIACTTAPTLGSTETSLSVIGIIMDIFFFAVCYAIPIFILYNCIRNILAGKAKEIPFIGFFRLVN